MVDIPSSSSISKPRLSDYLDSELNAEFNHPELGVIDTLAMPSGTENDIFNANLKYENEDKPHGYFASSARDWRNLLRRAARVAVIALEKGTGIDPSLSSGAFCVTKSGGRLRLICDRRPRNSQERSIRKAPLPSPPRFRRILLPRSHAIKLSGRGLKDFYYNLEVDEERWAKQAWGAESPSIVV